MINPEDGVFSFEFTCSKSFNGACKANVSGKQNLIMPVKIDHAQETMKFGLLKLLNGHEFLG